MTKHKSNTLYTKKDNIILTVNNHEDAIRINVLKTYKTN